MINNQPACGCSKSPDVGLGTLVMDDFLTIPENNRCNHCNSIAKKRVKK